MALETRASQPGSPLRAAPPYPAPPLRAAAQSGKLSGLSGWQRLRRLGGRAGFLAAVVLLLVPTLFVFFWMISLALKTEVENLASPPVFVPSSLNLFNFATVLEKSPFARFAINSLVVSTGSTALGLLIGVPAAYGIAKTQRYGLALLVLIARITPGLSYLIPWFILFRELGLTNTYTALIVTHLFIGLPLIIWVMIGFFEDIHPEMEDAALIDGCSRLQTFWHVAVPLTRPGQVVASILAFIFSWNNFIFAIVLAGPELRTLPLIIFGVLTYEVINWGPVAAAAFMVTAPVLVITLFLQRHIVAGITAGAVRG